MNKDLGFIKKVFQELNEDIVKKYSLLLLSALNNEPISGKTRFMKEMFLIAKNIPELELEADFEADSYGPNSDYVDDALRELDILGLIKNVNGRYELTELGKNTVKFVEDTVEKEEMGLIDDMKELFEGLYTDEVLAIIYFSYPEMADESLVRSKIEKNRVGIAISLIKKDKVSISKASEIAGMSFTHFYQLLEDRGIKVKAWSK